MKRYDGLWEQVIAWENLLLAARKARRGKRGRAEVMHFEFQREAELLRLQAELSGGTYQPGAFRSHWIVRPKRRLISAAPYRDRVVHHALMNVLEPILDRHFHPHSYACRHGKGTHAAADRLQHLLRRFRFFVQCDIRKYFPSIDHEILKDLFRRLIRDGRVLDLMDLIVDHSNRQEPVLDYFQGDDLFTPFERRRGLPIGNLTSQWFANWYLTGLDHYLTSHLGLRGYVRYCDDFVLRHDDRAALSELLVAVRDWLSHARLRLKRSSPPVTPVQAGLTFVGYRIWRTHRLLRKQNIRQFRRRVRWMRRAYARGSVEWSAIKPRLDSWMGHARQADSERLLRRISCEWTFVRVPSVP
jgi:retron-type reverse transcriptase